MVERQAIVFDGDDTLWETEALYDLARDEAARIVETAGLSANRFQELQREIDIQNVKVMGLTSSRFPTSSVEAYEALARQAGTNPSKRIRSAVYQASASVFLTPAPLYEGVELVVNELRSHFHLGLLTKGDAGIQTRRIAESGLEHAFEAISIVSDKTEAEFMNVLANLQCRPQASWSVGNSLGSDILPALSVGMMAVWIDAHVWGHERSLAESVPDDPRLHIAHSFLDVPKALSIRPVG